MRNIVIILISLWCYSATYGQLSLEPFASGFARPVDIAHSSDSSGRLFIVEQPGAIQVIDSSGLFLATFLDISDQVDDSSNEEGLLGLAFHPQYLNNGYFFVYYIHTDAAGNRRSVVSRFSVDASDPNRAVPASEEVVLRINQFASNHNGGDLNFGPDRLLYIGTGDGGGSNDPEESGQDLTTMLGKLLRIDVNTLPYTIPVDNPFAEAGGDTIREIWSFGLRNPWRFSFDMENHDLWIADVGQNAWEEINYVAAGAGGGLNFGWDCREGNHDFEASGCTGPFHDAIYEYDHGQGRSITGGYVLRGPHYNKYDGHYLFADYVDDVMWALSNESRARALEVTLVSNTATNISTFGQDQQGRVYAATRRSTDAPIFRIVEAGLLPVEILSVHIKRQGKRVELAWETGLEVNASHFEIERKIDDGSFVQIGIVPASGEGGSHHYDFKDPILASGKHLYRLKAIDLDGSFSYSMIVQIAIENIDDLLIIPNPARDLIQIRIPQKFEQGNLVITNLSGALLHSQAIVSSEMSSTGLEVDVTTFDRGVVLVQFSSQDAIFTQKLMLYQ
ncbi:MAG: PQQ-dependent sugar dehydrogenase [Saprospiraceae bacterium]|nr:PQQ-dependent sugar dehydrogenase [Saprospiraceae bacterium]